MMEFRQTGRQVSRGTRADAETHDKLFLFKNVALLRATYQVRLLLYRAVQEHKKLLIDMPKGSKVHPELQALAKTYRKHLEIVRA
jgi:hypothetical protein